MRKSNNSQRRVAVLDELLQSGLISEADARVNGGMKASDEFLSRSALGILNAQFGAGDGVSIEYAFNRFRFIELKNCNHVPCPQAMPRG